jgi:hypothetical protein
MKKLSLFITAFLVVAFFICPHIESYANLENQKNFEHNSVLPSEVLFDFSTVSSKYYQEQNGGEEIHSGDLLSSELFKNPVKCIQDGSFDTCLVKSTIVLSNIVESNTCHYTELKGLTTLFILKTRK